MANIITDLETIKKVSTVSIPTKYDISNDPVCGQFNKGYATCIFDHKFGKWMFGYHEDRQDALKELDRFKELAKQFPDVFNMDDYSEMYVFNSFSEQGAKWILVGVVLK